ncbi:glucose/arabinose dehydrogenase [Deinococcus yavapaiensis KR-236]|uniref:Glucose/arabinose dehydrogenase n=2 Tax=Deinococcus TaxID=1298 RepID=A0A318S454_9DEIO|nr:glucose/arabinose dehydrogenase [Deinococcus yavapaiensis KR-236]
MMLVSAFAVLTSCMAVAQDVRLNRVAGGLQQPLDVQNARDGSGRLFVVEQGGLVRVVQGGQVSKEPFLDVRDLTRAGGERGLLGLAFDPNFKANGRFFVNYTDVNGNTVIARYTARGDRADTNSATVLLRVAQPYANHNGGGLAFGPDGMLYAGLGDGGSGGDPQNNGQNLGSLLGKLLRLDVSGDRVAIPKDNPFVSRANAKPEIWAYGLRNPWRFSFDRQTGDLFIADVGQNRLEEINFQPRSSKGGENYGWRLKEASDCFQPRANCNRASLTDPILEYDHAQGVSVTGGYVYRGKNVPSLAGRYVYGDFGSGVIWAATRGENGKWTSRRLLDTDYSISAFGQDEDGELYVADYGSGNLYRFANR